MARERVGGWPPAPLAPTKALDNGESIKNRPDDHPFPAHLVLGLCRLGALHVAVRDNIEGDEIVVETAYRPDPALWEPDFKTRRKIQ